jgi:hypothetical protein
LDRLLVLAGDILCVKDAPLNDDDENADESASIDTRQPVTVSTCLVRLMWVDDMVGCELFEAEKSSVVQSAGRAE